MWLYKNIIFLLLSVVLVTASCGFKPLYQYSTIKNEMVGALNIPKIDGEDGFHIREELIKRLGHPGTNAYLLNLSIDTKKINEVITPNNEITSYRLIMTATYSIRNKDGITILPSQKSVARTGFSSSRNSTGYITQIAEESAKKRLAVKIADQISTRLSILSEKWVK